MRPTTKDLAKAAGVSLATVDRVLNQRPGVRRETVDSVSGNAGMDDIEHLCRHAKDHLADNGWLIIEHGYDQQQRVADCFAKNGYAEIVQQEDLSGQPRMTAGKRKF